MSFLKKYSTVVNNNLLTIVGFFLLNVCIWVCVSVVYCACRHHYITLKYSTIKLKINWMDSHFPPWLSVDSNSTMTNRSRGTVFSRSSCLLGQCFYLIAHSLLDKDLLTWQNTPEPWLRQSENSAARGINEPFKLADFYHFHWNVMKGLTKSNRLKETYLSCSFSSILGTVSVRQGCHNMDS